MCNNWFSQCIGLIYLHGVTDYGDAIEDEWLIVYMLRELTKSFTDLWVRVSDADGEFLLIEAANVLPKWLTPENDLHRVWIHNAKLFLIPTPPREHSPVDSQDRRLSLRDALEFLKSKPNALIQSPLIESEALYRLDKYPGHIADSTHHSLVTIPRKLAYVLHLFPKSISMAVEMFYLRDAITLKPVISPSGPLTFPPEDLVTMSIQFSKVLFAQLKSQRFDAPKRWQSALGSSTDQVEQGALEMGMKLTCGYEMLAVDAEKSKHRVVREVAILLQDIAEDGETVLPTDEEMKSWPNSQRNDSENWMDINYNDLERELDGQSYKGNRGGESGFGDSQTQTDLRKIVSRFEAFLNDDKAGLDGVDFDEMDNEEDDGATDSDEDSEFEDKAVSFDEEAFAQMMRDMMGLPQGPSEQASTAEAEASHASQAHPSSIKKSADDVDDLQQLSTQMEAELKQYGALSLKSEGQSQSKLPSRGQGHDRSEPSEEDEEGEIRIDYNLAQNLLESFKGQAGMAGPTSNLLGMMGFTLPRDEDDGSDEKDSA